MTYGVCIIGSGMAGLSAAIYAGRANNNPLVLRGEEPGGQLSLSSEVANYPGFEESVSGHEITEKMEKQASKFGAEIENGVVTGVNKSKSGIFRIKTKNEEEYTAEAVVIASGASARTLGVKGEDRFFGNGVSTCATCDAAFFKDEEVVLVGGGDAAMEESVFLTKFVDKVNLIHRREGWSAENHMIEMMKKEGEKSNINIIKNTEVTKIIGDKQVEAVKLVHHEDGHPKDKPEEETEERKLNCSGVFYAIGHDPNTDFLEEVETDDNGYILTQDGRGGMQTKTSREGIFAAGDVVDFHYQQAATASGMGVKAAMDVDQYLSDN